MATMPHPVERNAATAEEREQRLAEFGRAADKAALEDMRRRQDAQSGRPGEPLVGMTADGVPLDAEVCGCPWAATLTAGPLS